MAGPQLQPGHCLGLWSYSSRGLCQCVCAVSLPGAMGELDMVASAPENWSCSLSVPQRENCPLPCENWSQWHGRRRVGPGLPWSLENCAQHLHPTPHPRCNCRHKGKADPDPYLRGAVLVEDWTDQLHYHPGLPSRALNWHIRTFTSSMTCWRAQKDWS